MSTVRTTAVRRVGSVGSVGPKGPGGKLKKPADACARACALTSPGGQSHSRPQHVAVSLKCGEVALL
jgi:hypothetical protein